MRMFHISFLFLICLALAACNQKQSPEELKQRTAQATAELKDNAKAVAEGVKEGLKHNDKAIDINSASKTDLMALPGMTSGEADAVITGRPYKDPAQLVTRRILSQAEYDQISDKVVAK
jgi:DNA uptake protein ComE-like DNA-binding protein